ncbi:MAG: NFACT RNA binding domain-containing protein, partial [Nitrospinota bacterium]
NTENDELVKRSNGTDLWFHVRDFPGSHVVLRMAKKADIPADALKEAARLALKHSSRAKDKKAVVIYTHVKNIKKPKGAAPGKVIVTREKTIHVRLE